MNEASFSNIRKVLRKRRDRAADGYDAVSLVGRVLGVLLAGYLILHYVFLAAVMSGQAMFPALKDGDVLFGFRLNRDYVKNDVVVCTIEGQTMVSRVLAKGGDILTINADGVVSVNGSIQRGEIAFPTYTRDGEALTLEIPEGYVYLLGDYRTASMDSRDFGSVPVENVQAKIITVLRRRGI